jgi:hypothetical protein
MRRTIPTVGVALALMASPAPAQAQDLIATVGPDFTISLAKPDGERVTSLAPGTYRISVRDLSVVHNFHLFGPGVDQLTSVEGTGEVEWTVTFSEGRYSYQCDPHLVVMRGSFVVRTPAPPPPPAPAPVSPTLVATVGPGFAVALKTASGTPVRKLRAGRYTIVVRDRSSRHNFRLIGPGVRRATSVGFRGTVTWDVTLRAGTYRFRSDRKAAATKSFRVEP